MALTVRRGRSFSFGLKVGIATIAAFVGVGLVARLARDGDRPEGRGAVLGGEEAMGSSRAMVPFLRLDVPTDAPEKVWVGALARLVGGNVEVDFPRGRADVVSETHAIEVDRWEKWKEGLGQAIYYGREAGLIPTLALIQVGPLDHESLRAIDALSLSKGVRLVVLQSSQPVAGFSGVKEVDEQQR